MSQLQGDSFLLYFKIAKAYLGKLLYVFMALNVLSVVVESFGLLLFIPLLQSLEISAESPSKISTVIDSTFGFFGLEPSLPLVLLLLVGAFILKGIVIFSVAVYRQYLSSKLRFDMRESLVEGVFNLEYSYSSTKTSGYFGNLVVGLTNDAVHAIDSLSRCLTSLITTAVFVITALIVYPQLSGVIVVAGILNLVILRAIANFSQKCSSRSSALNAKLNGLLIELLYSMKYLKSTSRFAPLQKLICQTNQQSLKIQLRHSSANAAYESVREPLMIVFMVSIIYYYVVLQGQSVGLVVVPIMFLYRCMLEASFLQSYWRSVCDHSAGLKEVYQASQNFEGYREPLPASERPVEFNESIEFRNVGFGYGVSQVFDKLNLKIDKYSSIALVGASGAGKTTFVDLLTGLQKPQDGQILLDGVPLTDFDLRKYREKIGYVVQDTVIFSDTIANNISMQLGSEPDAVTLARVKKAAERSYVDEYVRGMPEGYDSIVGERGMRLSGGQKQRLAVARELYKNAEILILDESTSALDSHSEHFVKQSIDNLKGSMTVIIISHRLSTVSHVDQILVVEDGKITEKGTFEELLSSGSSSFRKMCKMQKVI